MTQDCLELVLIMHYSPELLAHHGYLEFFLQLQAQNLEFNKKGVGVYVKLMWLDL